MNKEITAYLDSLKQVQSDPYAKIEAYAAKHYIPIMESLGISFLQQIIRLYKPQRILEVGTAIGYSALKIAEAAPQAKIITLERNTERIDIAKKNIDMFKKNDVITCCYGDALDLMESYVQNKETFDFIFIDAAKGQYEQFFNLANDLLSPGGVIVTDNVLFKGYVANIDKSSRRMKPMIKKLQEFNTYIINHEQYITEIAPIGDGIAVSIKHDLL